MLLINPKKEDKQLTDEELQAIQEGKTLKTKGPDPRAVIQSRTSTKKTK